MTGNNTLTVCEAQMIKIVQQWVDGEYKSKPKVSGVKPSKEHQSHNFDIKLLDSLAEQDEIPAKD